MFRRKQRSSKITALYMDANERSIFKKDVINFLSKEMEIEATIEGVRRIEEEMCFVKMRNMEKIDNLKNKGKLRMMREITQ